MAKYKSGLLLIFLVAAAVVLGSLVTGLCSDVSWLSWLTKGIHVSLGNVSGGDSPLIDLSVIQFNIGFSMNLSVVQIVFIAVALLINRKVN